MEAARVQADAERYSKLVATEIPNGRKALLDSHKNLEDLAVYCEQTFANATTADIQQHALHQSKQYTIQSLASVAYMVNNMATYTLELFNHQCIQLNNLESTIRNIKQNTDIHREKVARKEVGVLTTAKILSSHKIIRPEELDYGRPYDRAVINPEVFDAIGYGYPKAGPKSRRVNNIVSSPSMRAHPKMVSTGGSLLFVAAPTAPTISAPQSAPSTLTLSPTPDDISQRYSTIPLSAMAENPISAPSSPAPPPGVLNGQRLPKMSMAPSPLGMPAPESVPDTLPDAPPSVPDMPPPPIAPSMSASTSAPDMAPSQTSTGVFPSASAPSVPGALNALRVAQGQKPQGQLPPKPRLPSRLKRQSSSPVSGALPATAPSLRAAPPTSVDASFASPTSIPPAAMQTTCQMRRTFSLGGSSIHSQSPIVESPYDPFPLHPVPSSPPSSPPAPIYNEVRKPVGSPNNHIDDREPLPLPPDLLLQSAPARQWQESNDADGFPSPPPLDQFTLSNGTYASVPREKDEHARHRLYSTTEEDLYATL